MSRNIMGRNMYIILVPTSFRPGKGKTSLITMLYSACTISTGWYGRKMEDTHTHHPFPDLPVVLNWWSCGLLTGFNYWKF